MSNGNNSNNNSNNNSKVINAAITDPRDLKIIEKQLDTIKIAENNLSDIVKKRNELQVNNQGTQEELIKLAEYNLEIAEKKLQIEKDTLEVDQKRFLLAKRTFEAGGGNNKALEAALNQLNTGIEGSKKKVDGLKDTLEDVKEKTGGVKKEFDDIKAAAKGISDNFGTLLFDTLTMKSYSSSIFKSFIDIKKKGQDWNAVTKQVRENMKNIDMRTIALEIGLKAVFGIVNLIKNETMAMVKALDEAGSSITKLSGGAGGRNMVSRLYGSSEQMADFGLTIRETAKAQGELIQSFLKYSELDNQTQTQLANTAALFEAAGGSSKEFAVSMDILNNSLGLSVKKSVDVTKSLVSLGKQLKMDQKTIQTGFNQAMKELAGFGLEGVQMFKDLQITAKKAGVQVSELTKVFGDAMDTFEGSSKVAATLNTMLGSQFIDSNKLLFGTRQERIMEVLQGFERSGKDFRSMSFFMKKEITKQLGFSSIQAAMSVLGKSTAEYAKSLEKIKEAKKAQKPLEDLGKASATLSKKFDAFKAKFAFIAEGFLKVATAIVDGLNSFTKANGKTGKALVILGGLLITGGIAWGAYKLAMMGITAIAGPVAASIVSLGGAMGAGGAAAAPAIPVLGAFALAIGAIGLAALGVGSILGGLGYLIKSIFRTDPEVLKQQVAMGKLVKDMGKFNADPLVKQFTKFFKVFESPTTKAFFKFAGALGNLNKNMGSLSELKLSASIKTALSAVSGSGPSSAVSTNNNTISTVSSNTKQIMVLKTNTVKLTTNDNTPIVNLKLGDVKVNLTGDSLLDSDRFRDALDDAIRRMVAVH